MSQIVVAAFYRFVPLADFVALREPMLSVLRGQDIFGTVLLAEEGINGTIAGRRGAIGHFMHWLRQDDRFADLVHKESRASVMPFRRQKVKLKREIVPMGVDDIDPCQNSGQYVEPQNWNALLDDPDVLVIDARNDYEVKTGAFRGATNPQTGHFRELPAWLDLTLDAARQPKVAMYCTGGIRCEKSTAYLRAQGFREVYQLRGGILKYLEEIPVEQSRWVGECFVFDDRVTVNHELQQGSYTQCHACRMPLSESDLQSEHFEKGVSCPHCFGKTTAEQRQNFAEREKQVRLAAERGDTHIAKPSPTGD